MNDSKKAFDIDKELCNSLAFRINDLENYFADVILNDELKEIYAEVQRDCEDFRNNVFFRNLEVIDENLGKLTTVSKTMRRHLTHKTLANRRRTRQFLVEKKDPHEEKLREIKTSDSLMEEFRKSATQFYYTK